eukprot:scaffold8842_cov74-Cyclotella_meneghiniana.AAC.6
MGESRTDRGTVHGRAPSSDTGGMMLSSSSSGAAARGTEGWKLIGTLTFGTKDFNGVDPDFVA